LWILIAVAAIVSITLIRCVPFGEDDGNDGNSHKKLSHMSIARSMEGLLHHDNEMGALCLSANPSQIFTLAVRDRPRHPAAEGPELVNLSNSDCSSPSFYPVRG
jgi:hypothetical protein